MFWLWWVFLTMCELSLVAASRDYSLVMVYRLLIAMAFLVVERGHLQRMLSICSSQTLEDWLNSHSARA